LTKAKDGHTVCVSSLVKLNEDTFASGSGDNLLKFGKL